MPRAPQVEAKPWPAFLEYFAGVWKPGEHLACVAPTGAGKSTFIVGLLSACRNYVLAFDPKGGDDTLRGSGWARLPAWPPPDQVYKDMAQGKPARFIVGPAVNLVEDLPKQRAVFAQALDGAFNDRGWTVYVDELQLLADRRMMNLTMPVERMLISARTKKLSVVSSYQRPANVPRTASDQAAWVAISYTRDKDVVDRLAEMLGRPKPEIRGALSELDPYCWLVVGRNPRMPLIITRPREVVARSADALP